ncbi:acetoin utilization AcuB family protein [Ectobacillus ponti]|uniref:Acetoin utilization AcuB family protein n=1 Tax=Ectobacillus ponti TaxID=2961894 RepID=A0AA41X603_9BACI|nr:acetoin utilization AcuB family protein [Ectobacillus ponti]MCP8967475.1 acetoin utilization AcuB family protein [Ectobacillus ponti]
MIVEEIMKSDAATLRPSDTIATALRILASKGIRHIPIVNGENEVVGIISDRDVRSASPSILDQNVSMAALEQPVERIMTAPVITCHPLDFVEEVAHTMYENKIGCMPVTREGKLVGILNEPTVLHTLVELTGAHQPSSQIEVKVLNEPGILGRVVAVFSNLNINIVSVLVYPDKDPMHKVLVFRIQTMNPLKVIDQLKDEGYSVLWPNLTGIS